MTEQYRIALRIEQAAATDWLNSLLNAPPPVVEATGLRVQRFGGAFATTMPKQERYPVNGASAVGIFEPATPTLLDDLTAYFKEAGVGFGISVNTVSRPESLLEWLMERGFKRGGRVPVLYRRVANPPPVPEGVRVERMRADQAALWRGVFGRMYVPYLADWMASFVGKPDRFHYLAYDGETPVAASQMSVTEGVACLHFSGVLPDYRGRGIQRAFIAQRLRDAAEAGCEWATSTADEDTPEEPAYSMRNLLACGFTLLHYSQGYDAPAYTAQS